ncbi:MAG: ABC-2 family transporter protein [Patescibacteria group bacterium]
MSSILRFYLISIQDALIYRWNIFFAIIGYSLSAMIGIHIVQRVYESGHQLGSYAEQPLLMYFLLVLAMDSLLYFGDAWNIVEEIHSGKITNFLVKPVSYYHARVAMYLGKASVRFITMIPALLLGMWFLGIGIQQLVGLHFWAFVPYFLIGLSLHICVIIILGVLSFPLQRASAGIFTFQTGIFLTGGKFIPLSLFPEWAQHILTFLPFHFMTFTPLSILLGQPTFLAYLPGVAIALLWLVGALILLKLLWLRGIKTYEGFGQ